MNARTAPGSVLVDLAVAFQFLTRLPFPQAPFAQDGLARSVKFFPLVGLLVGGGAVLVEKAAAPHLGRPGAAVVVLLFLLLITGCLHEDGLADVADSLGGWNTEQRLAILRDSRIGTYGTAALFVSLAARALLLAGLPGTRFAAYVISAHVVCRWSTLPLSYFLPAARPAEGQGARVARLTSTPTLIFGSLFTLATVIVCLHRAAIAPLLAAAVLSLLTSLFYQRQFGGVTGDCFGATNQLTEIAVYLCGVWQP